MKNYKEILEKNLKVKVSKNVSQDFSFYYFVNNSSMKITGYAIQHKDAKSSLKISKKEFLKKWEDEGNLRDPF